VDDQQQPCSCCTYITSYLSIKWNDEIQQPLSWEVCEGGAWWDVKKAIMRIIMGVIRSVYHIFCVIFSPFVFIWNRNYTFLYSEKGRNQEWNAIYAKSLLVFTTPFYSRMSPRTNSIYVYVKYDDDCDDENNNLLSHAMLLYMSRTHKDLCSFSVSD
jgi:hypothetical protein